MKKPIKNTPEKQASSAANVMALKKEFKVKLTELSKQFDKQLAEAKKAAQVKAVKDVHDYFAKHTKTKEKAVKDAIAQVSKAHIAKTKAPVKKPSKVAKAETTKKMSAKKSTISKKKIK